MSVAWELADDAPETWGDDVDQIGEYLIRRMVGEGGMGRVYEAEERLSKRRVALKVMREELSQSDDARRLFLNEMQILAHLEHANIVRSLASIEEDGRLVMVLEYLNGRTLRQLLVERERLPPQEAAYVVHAVAEALVAAHGQQPPVIHRDLKPENIMVLEDGTVKVMDFGIAKLVQELNQTNTQSVGTLQYMSPEQIDAHTIDHRSDLYALGLIFYELLAGHPPFQSASPRKLLNLQCTEPPPELPDEVRAELAKGIQKLLSKLLEKAPDERVQAAEDVVDRLEMFLPDPKLIRKRLAREGASDSGKAAPSDPERSGSHARTRRSSDAPPSSDPATPAPKTNTLISGEEPTSQQLAMANEIRKAVKDSSGDTDGAGDRKDTIALIDAASEPRELSTGMALLIVLVLMLVAGVATYLWRSAQTPVPEDEAILLVVQALRAIA